MPIEHHKKKRALDNIKRVVLQARLQQNKKLKKHLSYTAAELTAKGFGLGIWYGLVFVTIHFLVTTVRTGTLPHLFVAENGYLFLLGLGSLTLFGFVCGVASTIWNYMYPKNMTYILNEHEAHHQDKDIPKRIFNLAVVTLKFFPTVVHYLKAHGHLSEDNEEVSLNLVEVEAMLDSFRSMAIEPGSLKGDSDNEMVPLTSRSLERGAERGYGATLVDVSATTGGPTRCALFAHGRMPLSTEEKEQVFQEVRVDEPCGCDIGLGV